MLIQYIHRQSGSLVFKALDDFLGGFEFESQVQQAATAGPLSLVAWLYKMRSNVSRSG